MYFRKLKEKSGIKQNPICWPIYDRFVLITVSESIKMLYAPLTVLVYFYFVGQKQESLGTSRRLSHTVGQYWL